MSFHDIASHFYPYIIMGKLSNIYVGFIRRSVIFPPTKKFCGQSESRNWHTNITNSFTLKHLARTATTELFPVVL